MHLFNSIPKEKRTQLFFRSDGKFEFRRMELEDAMIVEKNKDGEIISGWPHFYQAQYPFPGYKNIPADMVTLSHARDIILDPHKLVPIDELPETAKNSFENELYNARKSDPLIALAWDTIPYMRTNDIEAHAECYRYVGQEIPDNLKPYYPKLF